MGSSNLDSLTSPDSNLKNVSKSVEENGRKPGLNALSLSKDLLKVMQAEVSRLAPEEACGVIAGFREQGLAIAQMVIPTTNILHSPRRYRMDPHEQLDAFNFIERECWELIAIYHSHPTGPSSPSVTDINEAYYPEVLYLIWSQETEEWDCRAYKILDQKAIELPVIIN
jgi:proteasome lid subunit RPN8/RPN11